MANNNIKKAEESNNDSKEFFSVREVAAMSGYSYGTVKRAIEQGNLAAYRIGRKFFIEAKEAEAYANLHQKQRPVEGYTIRELIKSGELKSRKIGRQYIVSEADFQTFLQKKRL